MSSENSPCILKAEPLHTAKWLRLDLLTWRDPTGKERQWESLCRTTRREGADTDGADIIAKLRKKGEGDKLILVKQFRPPMGAYTLEFPAGLMDPNESVETTAVRELYEETGYTGVVEKVSKAGVCMDPGASNCATTMVAINVDGDKEENVNPSSHLDEGEFADVICLPVQGLLEKLDELATSLVIDSRLYAFAHGLAFLQS